MMETKPAAAHAALRGKRIVQAVLALLLVLGAAMIALGLYGSGRHQEAGFDSEAGFASIYAMDGHLVRFYDASVAPLVDALPDAERARLAENARALLVRAWQSVLYDGESSADAARMNYADRDELLSVVAADIADADTRASYTMALDALRLLHVGMAADDRSSSEVLISQFAAYDPDADDAGAALQALERVKAEQGDEIARMQSADTAAFLEQLLTKKNAVKVGNFEKPAAERDELGLLRMMRALAAALSRDAAANVMAADADVTAASADVTAADADATAASADVTAANAASSASAALDTNALLSELSGCVKDKDRQAEIAARVAERRALAGVAEGAPLPADAAFALFEEIAAGLTQDDCAPAKLLSATKKLYAMLAARVGTDGAYDWEPLTATLLETANATTAADWRAQLTALAAARWSALLGDTLDGLIEKSAGWNLPTEATLWADTVRRLRAGEDEQALQKEFLLQMTAVRDAEQAAAANAYLDALPEGERLATSLKLLCAMDALRTKLNIPANDRAALSALPAGERIILREELLRALVAGNVDALPETTRAMADGGKTGDPLEMAAQLFFVSADETCEAIPASLNQGFQQNIRVPESRVLALRQAVAGEVSWAAQAVVSHYRQLILLGALLALDILLLTLLLWRDGSWRVDFKWIIILLIVDFMLVFQLLPIAYLLVRAFVPEGSFTFVTFERLYAYPMNWSALTNTLIAATATMILGTLLAFPLAWLVGRTNLHGRKFFRKLFVLTYMVPPYVGAMAWLRLLNNNVGTINLAFRWMFGLETTTGPLNIYTLGGLIWVLTTFYYPYAFITISRAMEKMDPSLEEASRISGASPLKTLMTVTLPMMTPSLIAGALLVFVCAASCYGIPSIIGAPGKIHTVTTRIIEYMGIGAMGVNDAVGMAVFLMVLAIIILYVSDFVVARKQYITVSGKSTRPNIVDLRSWRVPLTVLVSLFAVVVILIPFATILTTSFKEDVGKTLFTPGNFTVKQWVTIFSREETRDCLINSTIFGVVTATAGILVSCVMSYLLQRTRVAGRKIPDFLITLGSGTPSVVIALGLIMTMKGTFGVNIYNTAYIMIVAYLIKYLMMGMRTVVSAMSQIHVSLEECSQVSGASWLRTMFKITGPLIFPSIAAGWFLIFIPSFYELSMTTLLYSSTTKTIGFQLYEYWTFTSQPQSCAMAFGILMIVVALNSFMNWITKGEFSI